MYAVILALFLAVSCCQAAPGADTISFERKSASTAVLYSFLLPGLGQVYTESYWKVPIFTGAAVASAYFIATNQSDFSAASLEYDNAVAQGASSATTTSLLRRREFYRNNRDVAGLALLLTYALSAVDAFVGANLHDFNVDPNLTVKVDQTITSPLAFTLQVRF